MWLRQRAIVHRSAGVRRGPSTLLIDPAGAGELLKPFVALDRFAIEQFEGMKFGPHPHSGIATLTLFLDGAMTYADTTGKTGALSAGAVEWMCAGSGVWHAGEPARGQPMRGLQLWIALPPERELAPPQSLYLGPEQIESAGPARVILGQYEGSKSAIPSPGSMTYLHVRLTDGETWVYQPAPEHNVAFLAIIKGAVAYGDTSLEREIAIFAEGNEPIKLRAKGNAEMVIGSAAKHLFPLVTGSSSIHTSDHALAEGERNIAELSRGPEFAALRNRKPDLSDRL